MRPNPSRCWLAALTTLALAALACNVFGGGDTAAPTSRASTPTAARAKATNTEAAPEPTQPPKPTKTPEVKVTAEPTASPPPVSGDVVYFTDFDDLSDWSNILALPETDQYIAEINRGKLYIQVDVRDTTVYAFYDTAFDQSDVQIDAAVETVAGPNRNNISLVCRATDDGWYEFSMNSGGLWVIWRYDDNGFKSLKEGASTAINLQKAVNHLTAVCEGETLTLIVNDQEVGSVTDDTFVSGQVGVSVSTFDIKGAGVEFDALAVSIP